MEAPPFGVSERMTRGAPLRAERREMLARPRLIGVAGPPVGQFEHPLTGGADQLVADRDHAAAERLSRAVYRMRAGPNIRTSLSALAVSSPRAWCSTSSRGEPGSVSRSAFGGYHGMASRLIVDRGANPRCVIVPTGRGLASVSSTRWPCATHLFGRDRP